MLIAVGFFSVMDAGLKHLSTEYPTMEIVALRSAASIPFLLASIAWAGAWGRLRITNPWLYVGRAAIGVLMLSSFIYSVSEQALTDSYAIFMSAPLMVAVASRIVLGERIPARRWVAIVVGLLGVIVALKPSAAHMISLGGMAAFISAVCYAVGVLLIRLMSRTDSAYAMVLWYMVIICIASLALAAPHWQPVPSSHWPWIVFVGLTGAIAQYLLTVAFRLAPASKVAPFEYTAMVWGLLLDYFVFAISPLPRVLIGGAIVVVGGLYLIWDEHRADPVVSPAS
ncbi:MAG: DMT family transporter [Proteobacteria bacterium]|nr:DMT family transporter [Pseudomonadota bacterium]